MGLCKGGERVALYRKALEADAAFAAELRRAYGPQAQQRRYQPEPHGDARVQAALEAKLAADAAYFSWGKP